MKCLVMGGSFALLVLAMVFAGNWLVRRNMNQESKPNHSCCTRNHK